MIGSAREGITSLPAPQPDPGTKKDKEPDMTSNTNIRVSPATVIVAGIQTHENNYVRDFPVLLIAPEFVKKQREGVESQAWAKFVAEQFGGIMKVKTDIQDDMFYDMYLVFPYSPENVRLTLLLFTFGQLKEFSLPNDVTFVEGTDEHTSDFKCLAKYPKVRGVEWSGGCSDVEKQDYTEQDATEYAKIARAILAGEGE